jgi:hypothetical protein
MNYVVGFFDGEGCIVKAMYGKQRHISFSNTNLAVLEQIKSFLGFRLLKIKSKKLIRTYKKKEHKLCYELIIREHETVLRLCKEFLPYSLVKKDDLQEAR